MHRKKIHAFFWILLGSSIASLVIGIADFAQALILDDWSGIHPSNRLSYIPHLILISLAVAGLVCAAGAVFKAPEMNDRSDLIKFGAICGLATVSSLISPWISYSYDTFWICFMIAIFLAFLFRIRMK
jgi:ABC-type enterochelin transport system permease subunit